MTLDDLIERRSAVKTLRIVSHILFWVVLFASSYYQIQYSLNEYRQTPLSYLTPLRNIIALIVIFYPLMYIVMPQFLKKKRWLPLLFYLGALVFIYTLLEAIGEKIVFAFCESCTAMAKEKHPDYLGVIQKSLGDNILFKASNFGLYVNLFSGLILPIAIKSSLGYYQIYTKNLQLEKENVQLELNFLKAQVNPHFLFNTLNNLYGLIIHKHIEESAETVTRLSDYMRYSLENVTEKSILLSDEVRLIKNYIELERLRLNHTKVLFSTNFEETKLSIPPLLFIPLIENAFKYNIDKKDTDILIDLKTIGNKLHFSIQNAFDKDKGKRKSGGLGLSNLKKRLGLYFSDKYVYNVSIKDGVYKVNLELDLE